MTERLFTYSNNGEDGGDAGSLSFYNNGTLDVDVYSYYVDSYGNMVVPADKTRELYEAMRAFYEGEEK